MIALFNLDRHPLTPAMDGHIEELLSHIHAHLTTIVFGDFRNLALANKRLGGLTFDGCSFDHASLSNALLDNCTFRNCTFVDTNLDDCSMLNCSFYGCDFTNASFIGAVESRSTFRGNDFSKSRTFFSQTSSLGLDITAIDEILQISANKESITVGYIELQRDWYYFVHSRLQLTPVQVRMLDDATRHLQRLFQFWLRCQSTPTISSPEAQTASPDSGSF